MKQENAHAKGLATKPFQAAWNWSLSSLEKQSWIKNISGVKTDYPIRFLRYWFMYHLVKEHQMELGRPLRVCEVGVDRGQMRRYVQDAGFTEIACWEAVDYKIQPELMESEYTKQIQANVDSPEFSLAEKYDVIIVLHLLEHLFEPERLTLKLSAALNADGILIGGFPVVPEFMRAYRQKKIRLTAEKFGHVSTFSPQRVQKMAQSSGLVLDFLAGAFFLRKSNSFLENHTIWMRLNLLWGAFFPAFSGEIYWKMRKQVC